MAAILSHFCATPQSIPLRQQQIGTGLSRTAHQVGCYSAEMVHLFTLLAGNGLILAIFVLGVLALPNSPDMRKVLSRLPLIGAWIKKSDTARYLVLKRIHNNSYQLIVLLIRHSIKLLIRWVALGVAVLLAFDVANIFIPEMVESTRVILLVVALAFVCPVFGLIQWIFWTRKLLYDARQYDFALRKLAREARQKKEEELA